MTISDFNLQYSEQALQTLQSPLSIERASINKGCITLMLFVFYFYIRTRANVARRRIFPYTQCIKKAHTNF